MPFRTFHPDTELDAMHLQVMRDAIKRSCDILAANPPPDSFAGRKTQEPFPKGEAARVSRWVSSKKLHVPK